MIRAKIKVSLLVVLAVWVLMLAMFGCSFVIPHTAPGTESLAHFLIRHATVKHVLLTILAVFGLVFLSWLGAIKSFAMNLYGRRWLGNSRVFASITLIAMLPFAGRWMWLHRERQSFAMVAVGIVMCMLIIFKIATAVPIVNALRRRHLASKTQLYHWTITWVVLAAGLLAATLWLISEARHSVPATCAAIVLLLPYNRVVVMPLAWHLNRHR